MAGPNTHIVTFVHLQGLFDSVRATVGLREQIAKIEPQPVITRENIRIELGAVIYSLATDSVRATNEVQNLP